MAEQFVTGLAKLMATLVGITKAVERDVTKIVEVNAIRVKNHAKAGHGKGMLSESESKLGFISGYSINSKGVRTDRAGVIGGHSIGRYWNQTTNLTNSIQSTNATNSGGVISAEVRTNKEYAAKVEFGTSRTAAYPFMRPASAAIEPRFLADLRGLKIGE